MLKTLRGRASSFTLMTQEPVLSPAAGGRVTVRVRVKVRFRDRVRVRVGEGREGILLSLMSARGR